MQAFFGGESLRLSSRDRKVAVTFPTAARATPKASEATRNAELGTRPLDHARAALSYVEGRNERRNGRQQATRVLASPDRNRILRHFYKFLCNNEFALWFLLNPFQETKHGGVAWPRCFAWPCMVTICMSTQNRVDMPPTA